MGSCELSSNKFMAVYSSNLPSALVLKERQTTQRREVRPLGWFTRIRWFVWFQILLLALLAVFWSGYLQQSATLATFCMRTDFLGIYVGARGVATGHGPDLYDLREQRAIMNAAIAPNSRGSLMAFVYPAYVAVVLQPLGRLSFTGAYLVWFGINLFVAIWTIQQLLQLFAKSLGTRNIIFACMAWLPLQLTLFHGQLSMLPTLGIAKAMAAMEEGKSWRAGAWLSLGLMKPQLMVFPALILLVWGCWRALAVLFAAALGALLASIVTVGFWIPNYVRFLAEYTHRGAELALYPKAMQNWRGLVTSLLGTDGGWLVWCLVAFLSAVSMLAAVQLTRRWSPFGPVPTVHLSPSVWEPRYGVALLLGVLSSPHSYMHDWVLVLPAGMALWKFGLESAQQKWRVPLLGLLAFAPGVFLITDFSRKWFLEPVVPVYVSVIVVIAWLGLRDAEKPGLRQPHKAES